jgi:antitoxin FitA
VASMTIRNLDEKLKARLRVQAAKHGRSMEDEARDILRTALATPASRSAASLVRAIRRRVEPLGGVDLQLASREPMREPVNLEE